MRSSESIAKALAAASSGDKGALQLLFNGRSVEQGTFIGRQDAESAPELRLAAADASKTYIVVGIDLDAPFPSFSPLGPILHWIQPGLRLQSAGSDDHSLTSSAPFITDYIGPGPPPGSGPHRYVFIVYEQPSSLVEKDFAPPSGQKVGLGARVRWSLDDFEKKAALSAPVAVSYFLSN